MSSSFDQLFEEQKQKSGKPSSNFDDLFDQVAQQQQISRPRSLISAPAKGALKSLQNINPLMPGPISSEFGEKIIEKMLPTRNLPAERHLERAGALAPFVATGPEGILAKGAQLAGGTFLGQMAEERKLGKGGQALAEVVGMSLPGLMKSLGSSAFNFLKKGFVKSAGETTAKLAKIKPEVVNEGLRESAQRLGVLEDLPLAAQVKNPRIQSIETMLMQSASGKPLHEKIERTAQKLSESYKEVGKTLSSRENLLPSVVSAEASSVLKGIEEGAENLYRSLYSEAEKLLPETSVAPAKIGEAIHRVIDSTIKKLTSAMGTAAKDALVNRLTRLKNAWSATPELRAGNIPINDLIELKKDLNQVIKYEAKGGVDKALTPLFGISKEAIQSYGRRLNPRFLEKFNEAEKIFGKNAETFRKNPVMRSLVKGENPEQIFGRMNSVKGINDLEKVFFKSPEGIQTFDALKKYKLEDLLNKKVLDKNGEISWGKAAGMLKDPKTRDLVMKLVGPQQYKKLKDLSKVASGVEEGFKKFLNTSKTATTTFDLAIFAGLPIKAAQQLFSGNVLGALRTTAGVLAPGQLAKLIANPEFVEAAIATAKAGKGKSAENFLKEAHRVAAVTAQEMITSSSEEPLSSPDLSPSELE